MSLNNTDIWGEILVRLPAECLIRMRAVCNGFRAVIDDPCFVRSHTNTHQQQQLSSSNIIILNKTKNCSVVATCYSLDLKALKSCSSNGHQAIAATPLDLNFISHIPKGLSLRVAACNGLVLTEKPAFTIWNPLTLERLDLPPAPDFSIYKSSSAFGLGYDSTTDDYKAVVILSSRETHVYSLKSDSWRRIMNCPPCDGYSWGPEQGHGVFVYGALFWLSKGEGGVYDDKIVALDLGTEKYRLLQMPQTRWNYRKPNSLPLGMLLNVLGGCLALSESSYCSHLDVWVMKEYGVEDDSSWIKVFSIEYERNIHMWRGNLRPAAFIMKKEKFLVFLQDSCDGFFLFDVGTKSLKSVKIDGSIIRESLFSYAKQMFVGSIFRLHANCGGGVRKIATSTSTKKKVSSSADLEFVFCIRDAKTVYPYEFKNGVFIQ